MKTRIMLGIILMLSSLIVTVVATMAPTMAYSPSNSKKFYGATTELDVWLPSNSTPPAPAGAATNHPSPLIIGAFDYDRRSAFGEADELWVHKWDSYLNAFQPIAVITDNAAEAEFLKTVWNNTYVWMQAAPNVILFPNVILVEPKDLEVWTTSSGNSKNGRWDTDDYGRTVWTTTSDTLWINLTKPVKITLPAVLNPATVSLVFVDQSFTVPPMTIDVKSTSDPWDGYYKAQLNVSPVLSQYTWEWTGMAEYAAARTVIRAWSLGYWPINTGFVYWRGTFTYTPP